MTTHLMLTVLVIFFLKQGASTILFEAGHFRNDFECKCF